MNPNEQNNNQQPANDSYGQLPQNQPLPTQQPINGSVPLGQPQVQAVPMQNQPMVFNGGSNPLPPLGGATMNGSQPTTPMMSGNTVALKKGRKKLLIVSSLSFVLLAGGAVAAYLLFFAKPTPQKVVAGMWAKTLESKSLTLGIKASGTPISTVDADIKNKISKNALQSNIELSAQGKSFGAELRMPDLSKFAIFIKLANFKQLLGGLSAGDGATAIDDKWFVVDQKTVDWYAKILAQSGSSAANIVKKRSLSENYADVNKLFSTITGSMKKNNIMTFVKELSEEDASGEKSYHYEVTPSKEQLKNVLKDIKNSKNMLFTDMKDQSWKSAEDSIDKVDYSKTPVEIWVGKDTGKLRKIKAFEDTKKSKATEITFTEFDSSIKVDEPQGAVNLLDLFQKQFEGAQRRAKDVVRQTDINAMATHLEVYFNDNNGYPSYNDIKSDAWVTKNMPGIDAQAFIDPNDKRLGQPGSQYTYSIASSAAGCVSPTNSSGAANPGTHCQHFSLSAVMDDGSVKKKNSLN